MSKETSKPIDITTMMSDSNKLFDYLLNHQNLIDSQSEKSNKSNGYSLKSSLLFAKV